MSDSMERRLFIALLVGATLLAAGLRLYRLADPSLWADEMFTIRDALSGYYPGYLSTRLGLIASGVPVETIGPEDYASFASFGMDEWRMRIGSCLLGILAIPLLGLASASFLGRRAAAILALLLALHTWHLNWSQHARFYAPMFLYFSLALALYFAAVRSASPLKLIGAMLAAWLAIGVKPTSLVLFGVFGVDLAVELVRRRAIPVSMPTLAILAIGAIVGLAIGLSAGDAASTYTFFTERRPGESPLRTVAGNAYMNGIPLVGLAGLSALLLWRKHARLVTFLVASVAVPLAAFAVLAAIAHVELRYTFINSYGWLALAALGLGALWGVLRPVLGLLGAALPVLVMASEAALSLLFYYESGYGNRARWRDCFEYVQAHRKPGEGVITLEKWAGQFYLEDPTVRSVDLDFDALSELDADTWFVVKTGAHQFLEGSAELREVFSNRIPYPQNTLRVYLYRPGAVPASGG